MSPAALYRSEEGSALMELAVALPVVVLLLFATIDFGRVFYTTMAVTNAARTGAQYGAQNVAKSADTAGMEDAARGAAAGDVGVVVANASRMCLCASASGSITPTFPMANDCSNACTGGHLIVIATVTASKTFTTVVSYPGIPSRVTIERSARMRAQ